MCLSLKLLWIEIKYIISDIFFYLKEVLFHKKEILYFDNLSIEQINIINALKKYPVNVIHKLNRGCGVSSALLISIIENIIHKKNYNVLILEHTLQSAMMNRKILHDFLYKASKVHRKLKVISEIDKMIIVSYNNKRHYIRFDSFTNYRNAINSLKGVIPHNELNIICDNMIGISEDDIKDLGDLIIRYFKSYTFIVDDYALFPEYLTSGIPYNDTNKRLTIINKINFYLGKCINNIWVSKSLI